MEQDREFRNRVNEFSSLFKNSLVYTMVMRNVDIVLSDRTGSVTLLSLAFFALICIIHAGEQWASAQSRKTASELRVDALIRTGKVPDDNDDSSDDAAFRAALKRRGGAPLSPIALARKNLQVTLLALVIFIADLASNAAVQFLSNLVARIGSDSVAADSLNWTIATTVITSIVAFILISVRTRARCRSYFRPWFQSRRRPPASRESKACSAVQSLTFWGRGGAGARGVAGKSKHVFACYSDVARDTCRSEAI